MYGFESYPFSQFSSDLVVLLALYPLRPMPFAVHILSRFSNAPLACSACSWCPLCLCKQTPLYLQFLLCWSLTLSCLLACILITLHFIGYSLIWSCCHLWWVCQSCPGCVLTWVQAGPESRPSSVFVKSHQTPFLCLSVVFCFLTQSIVRRKRNPDISVGVVVVTFNHLVCSPSSWAAHSEHHTRPGLFLSACLVFHMTAWSSKSLWVDGIKGFFEVKCE